MVLVVKRIFNHTQNVGTLEVLTSCFSSESAIAVVEVNELITR